jgi:predicted transcriptional regulator
MAEKNERKYEILSFLLDHDMATAQDVAYEFDLDITNARMLLLKYYRQGLIGRKKIDKIGTRIYYMRGKGIEKLEWLEGVEQDTKLGW